MCNGSYAGIFGSSVLYLIPERMLLEAGATATEAAAETTTAAAATPPEPVHSNNVNYVH